MTRITSLTVCWIFFLAMIIIAPGQAVAQEQTNFVPNKALCAKMLRFGKESYSRGKYLDAKEYFRKAVQADPGSLVAWRYYDQAVIFALAEKVEKSAGLLTPDVSARQEPQESTVQPPPPPAQAKPQGQDSEFKIIEDEGC
ncbi:MAG TPA: hypothetical protein ENH70_01365 [Desulfobacteraceae bacterium]|nr:hypothetical protein [Desulfobacteraceae bacterium]